MRTAAQWLAHATPRLGAVSETPRLDAELILAHAMSLSRAAMLARLREPVPNERDADAMLARRERGEPLAYVFGAWEFFSLEFEVKPPALVPRPETEHLVEAVLEFAADRPIHVLDLCTGTGCVAVAIAANAPNTRIVAADIDPRYVALTRRNALRHGVADRVECRESNLFSAMKHGETFDVLCANPPYVEATSWETLPTTVRDFEDPRALLGGPDGLDIVRAIVVQAADFLRPAGLLALEIGHGQAEAVRRLLVESGYENVQFRRDLAGIERIAVAATPALPPTSAKEISRTDRLPSKVGVGKMQRKTHEFPNP